MSEITVGNLGEGSDELVPFEAPGGSPIIGMHGGEEEGIRFPFFAIIHGVGGSFAKYPKNVGDFIYNGEVLVEPPVEITFMGGKTQYVQNIPYDPTGPIPNTYDSVNEVLAAGGNIKPGVSAGADDNNYRASQSTNWVILFAPKKSWASQLDLVIANGNELLVPAIWTLRKTAHWALNPQLKMAEISLRKAGKILPHQRWKLTTRSVKYSGGNSTFVPVLSKIEKLNSDETMALITENFGG